MSATRMSPNKVRPGGVQAGPVAGQPIRSDHVPTTDPIPRVRLRRTRDGWQIVPPTRAQLARTALTRRARCLGLGRLRGARVEHVRAAVDG